MSDPVVIDARGHLCPVPGLKLAKAMAAAPAGARLVLLATDPMARIDVPHTVRQQNGRLVAVEDGDRCVRFTVETGVRPDVPTG